ncbi:hypothetical protein C5Y96_10675 [Blastopirellula marina]|uniref:Uncharacterized protein n=1 Tax=Blastopirellula marina TaxID=124 RepID=A0A2S8FMF3_9BACT|nr:MULTISPECIES: hypothetical protein [Pirellulaceae]PQO33307.1 hypothetical protein C5Y96_10675 [Blastopirellula marina]RCS52396.1 hypothetical protein DTL36_10685 [Bremerella cremea]
MQVTQANSFDGNGEALVIVNQIAAVVDEILPGEPPFGDREIHVTLDDRKRAVPHVRWEKQDHAADVYRITLKGKADAWYQVIYEGFCRTLPLAPGNLRGVRKESHQWQELAFQLSHELTHVKLGPARSNLPLEVLATSVSLETLHRLESVWKKQPPRMSQGTYRAKRSFREFHNALVDHANETLPRGDDFGPSLPAGADKETLLKHWRRHVDALPLWDLRSRAWQMLAADWLLDEWRAAQRQREELIGLAVHTFPSAWDDRTYRDDLPLVSDVVPLWWPQWMR